MCFTNNGFSGHVPRSGLAIEGGGGWGGGGGGGCCCLMGYASGHDHHRTPYDKYCGLP